jgi:iron complex transport system permease protein
VFAVLTLLLVICVAFALSVGSVSLRPVEIWQALVGSGDPLQSALIWELRLPRALAALATGGLLALAGALMQVLLRNPLADPYVLGISGGAGTGALAAMLLGLNTSWISAGAFASFLLAISPDRGLRGMLFWLMGDLSSAGSPTPQLLVLALGTAITFPLARMLNLLSLGEAHASALGVSVAPLRLVVYVLASLLTASAVTLAGSIGFVGLIVPHIVRLMLGSDHRRLLPASVMLGASLLVVADTLARSLASPNQLPVGVLTAFIGVPTFLYLLRRSH